MQRINENDIFHNMMNTMRNLKVTNNRRLVEEYEGDYEKQQSGEDEVVSEETYPGVRDQIVEPLTQKIPNISLSDDSLKFNRTKSTITLTGEIPNLANLSFVITTDISNTEPLHITVDALNLTEDGLASLQALYGYAKVLYTEWSVNKVKETFK